MNLFLPNLFYLWKWRLLSGAIRTQHNNKVKKWNERNFKMINSHLENEFKQNYRNAWRQQKAKKKKNKKKSISLALKYGALLWQRARFCFVFIQNFLCICTRAQCTLVACVKSHSSKRIVTNKTVIGNRMHNYKIF